LGCDAVVLGARAIPVWNCCGDVYRRTIAIGDASGVISVPPADKNRVTFRALPHGRAAGDHRAVRRVFDLAADPDMIGAHLSLDPMLAPLVSVRPGLRVPGAWDGFELAVRAIFGQQITVPAATRLLGRLVAAHGALLARRRQDVEVSAICFHRRRVSPRPISLFSACRMRARWR